VHLDNIKGYDFNQILFLYGFATVSYAIWHCFFINTISMAHYTKNGLLDGFLLKPISPLFQIMTDGFDDDGWSELLFGILILAVAIGRLEIMSWSILLIPILVVSGALIYASIALLGSIMSFISVGYNNLSDVVMDMFEFAKYPLTIFPNVLRTVMTIILPIGFASYFPSAYFMSTFEEGKIYLLLTPIYAVIFFAVTCKLWNYSLRFYKSSGS
jgi:ABC-2 type transport system permease protein